MSAPRILITYPFPLGRATGGARMTREIARHVARAGTRVTILPVSASIGRGAFPRPPLDEEFEGREFDADLARDGVEVVRVAQHPAHWLLDAAAVRREVLAIARRERVDAVLSYYSEGAGLPDALEPLGIPFGIIATWQSYAEALAAPLRSVPRFLWSRVTRRTAVEPYRRARVLFATSGFTRDELVAVFGVAPDRIRVCPLGVDPAFLELPLPEAPHPVRRLLFFGRIIPSKGVGDAIEALGRLAREGGPEFEFRLVGQGQHDWARGLAREHGIEDRVSLRGPAADGELREELARAHVAVLPSRFEAFGLAFAEAQAAGLPVVAFRAGSVPEVVADGETGWLAERGDVEGLAAGLRAALADPEETFRRGRAARARVRERFTWERTAETILTGLAAVGVRRPGAPAERTPAPAPAPGPGGPDGDAA